MPARVTSAPMVGPTESKRSSSNSPNSDSQLILNFDFCFVIQEFGADEDGFLPQLFGGGNGGIFEVGAIKGEVGENLRTCSGLTGCSNCSSINEPPSKSMLGFSGVPNGMAERPIATNPMTMMTPRKCSTICVCLQYRTSLGPTGHLDVAFVQIEAHQEGIVFQTFTGDANHKAQ